MNETNYASKAESLIKQANELEGYGSLKKAELCIAQAQVMATLELARQQARVAGWLDEVPKAWDGSPMIMNT